jgi:hypothetical protein
VRCPFRRLNRSWLLFARDEFLDRAGGDFIALAALPLFLALGSLKAGAILFGSLLVVMIGGGIGRTEPHQSWVKNFAKRLIGNLRTRTKGDSTKIEWNILGHS